MAIAAVNTKAGDMVLVAERHRLWFTNARISDVRRALDLHRDPAKRGNYKDRAKNRGPGQGIGAAMKNLRHAGLRLQKTMDETLADAPVYRNAIHTTHKKHAQLSLRHL